MRLATRAIVAALLVAVAASAAFAQSSALAAPDTLLAPPTGIASWYQTPPVVLIPPSPKTVTLYRWDCGPGPWSVSPGIVRAPIGRHALQVATIDASGTVAEASTVLRSDLRVVTAEVPTVANDTARYGGAASVSGSVNVGVVIGEPIAPIVERLGGANRYDVAAAVSQHDFGAATTVILATGEKFPDALAASPLAGCLNAPILLTPSTYLIDVTAYEIGRLGARKVVIVGGTASVSPGIEKRLKQMGLEVERLGGKDRYVNSSLVSAKVMTLRPEQTRVMVASGEVYPDALSLSPGAYHLRSPILLVQSSKIPPTVEKSLAKYRFTTGVVAGGPATVSPATYRRVDSYVGTISRLGGADRYAVARNVADRLLTLGCSASYTGVASGEKFPDALTGGAGTGARSGVMLLTTGAKLAVPTKQWITAHQYEINTLHVFGGPATVSPFVFNQIRTILR